LIPVAFLGDSTETAVKDLQLEDEMNFLARPFEMRKLAQTLGSGLDQKS
jgi:hypothetical protein